MSRDAKHIIPDLEKFIAKHRSKQNMKKIGEFGRDTIKRRTRTGGKDANDRPLAPLSGKYVDQKKRKGRKQPSKSRLTDSGEMLDSMVVDSTIGTAIISFEGEMEERAQYNEDMGRVFFDISPKDERKLNNYIRKLFRKITNTEI